MKIRVLTLLLVLILTLSGCTLPGGTLPDDRIDERLDALEDRMDDLVDDVENMVDEVLDRLDDPSDDLPNTNTTAPAKETAAPAQPPQPAQKTTLTKDEAVAIALSHAGLTGDQITGPEVSYDVDDGVPEYDVEFYSNGLEYEYEIHAETGQILSYERDD